MKKKAKRSTVVLRTITAIFILIMAMVTSCSPKKATEEPMESEVTTQETTTAVTTQKTTTVATTQETTTQSYLPAVDSKAVGCNLLTHYSEFSAIDYLMEMEVGDTAKELAHAINIVSRDCKAKSADGCTIEDAIGIFITNKIPVAMRDETTGHWIVIEQRDQEFDNRLDCITKDGFRILDVEDFTGETYEMVYLVKEEYLEFDDSSLRMEYLKEAMTISDDSGISMEEAFHQMNADYEIVLQTREGYEEWLRKLHMYVAVQTTDGKWVVITSWQPESGITYVDKNGEIYKGLAEDVLPEEVKAIYPFI